jgi:hypothetical protein
MVGYRGNSVYQVVAWIPVWVTCGDFPWKAPTRHGPLIYLTVINITHFSQNTRSFSMAAEKFGTQYTALWLDSDIAPFVFKYAHCSISH